MHGIKRGADRLINRRHGVAGPLWGRRFFDRVVRNQRELQADVDYIHANPVKAGLVEKPEEYAYSSANPVYDDLSGVLSSSAETVFEGEWCK